MSQESTPCRLTIQTTTRFHVHVLSHTCLVSDPEMDDLQKQVRNVKFAAFDDLMEKIVSDANYSAAAAAVAVIVILLTFGLCTFLSVWS